MNPVPEEAGQGRPESLLARTLGYNVLNAMQLGLAVAFQVLLARTFGASVLTDAYLTSVLLVNFLATLASALAETFTQHYHELKAQNAADAARFYQAVLNNSLAVGLATSVAAVACAGPLAVLIAPGFDAARLATLRSVFSVLALSLIGSAALRVNATLLRAELRLFAMYSIALLTPGLNCLAVVLGRSGQGVMVIAAAGVASTFIGVGIQQAYIRRVIGIPWAPVWRHPQLAGLAGNSLLLRLGHQIWDLKDVAATNILSQLPGGTVTLYLYGARIIAMAYAVVSSAGLEMFLSLTSQRAARRDYAGMRALVRRSAFVFTSLFVVMALVLAVTLPSLLSLLVGAKLSAAQRDTIYGVFLALVPFYLVLSVEAPWVTVAIALRQGGRVALVGTAFITIFWAVAAVLRPSLGVYAIPAAMAIAQVHSFLWYWMSGRRALGRERAHPAEAPAPT